MSSPQHSTAGCDYCGLPVAVSAPSVETSSSPLYCCYGCRFAAAVAQERGEAGQLRWNLTSLGLAIFFSMNVMVFTLVLWSLDVFPNPQTAEETQAALLWDVFRYLCLLFSLPVLLLLGGPLLENAWLELRRGSLGTDLLLIAGVAAAYVYSAIAVFHTGGHVYFEVGCMILVAVTLGRWLEATGKWKATDALKSLSKLLPSRVDVLRDGGYQSCPLAEVAPGDQLRVLAGQRIPTDGFIAEGISLIDEQIVTGESQPVTKSTQDKVYGGTLNLDGNLLLEATAKADDGALQRLIDAVVAAASASDRWRRLADRVSTYFTPMVLIIALATFATHWLVLSSFAHGLMAALAVLLIACPCALGVATPLATWAALGSASRRGVLFRDGDSIARLAKVDTIGFDKTGTLTDSRLTVVDFLVEDPTEEARATDLAQRMGEASNHVIASAISSFCQRRAGESLATSDNTLASVQTVAGRGVSAWSASLRSDVLLGSETFFRQREMVIGPAIAAGLTSPANAAKTCSLIGWEGEAKALFMLGEHVRPAARDVLQQVAQLGIQASVWTGDRQAKANHLAEDLLVDVHAELLPQDKLARVEALMAQGHHVAMIGDGMNDAPALATADVGIALGCGADVSRDAADVCLIHDDLTAIPYAIELARATQRTIRNNLLWAFSYNSIGIVLAATGWLNPMLAALAMAGSSLVVVTNSLKLANKGAAGDEVPVASSRTESERTDAGVSTESTSRPTTGPLESATAEVEGMTA